MSPRLIALFLLVALVAMVTGDLERRRTSYKLNPNGKRSVEKREMRKIEIFKRFTPERIVELKTTYGGGDDKRDLLLVDIGVSDPITLAAVSLAVNLLNPKVKDRGQTIVLKDVGSVNVDEGLQLSLELRINFDVNVIEADHVTQQVSTCNALVAASLGLQISSVDSVSCGGNLVDLGIVTGVNTGNTTTARQTVVST